MQHGLLLIHCLHVIWIVTLRGFVRKTSNDKKNQLKKLDVCGWDKGPHGLSMIHCTGNAHTLSLISQMFWVFDRGLGGWGQSYKKIGLYNNFFYQVLSHNIIGYCKYLEACGRATCQVLLRLDLLFTCNQGSHAFIMKILL